jgi:hypothetical protein
MLTPINKLDFSNIDWSCFEDCKKDNESKLQALVYKVCEDFKYEENNGVFSIDLSRLVLCGKDNSDYTYKECFEILNVCFPELTLEALLQAIIKRLNTYSFQISQLKLQLNEISNKYISLESKVNTLEKKISNCCP